MACLDNPRTFGKAYNVGTGKKTTVEELVKTELEAFGHKEGQYPVRYATGTPGDTFGIQAQIAALQADTGWVPKVDLSTGIARMVKWAKSLPVVALT
jgi:nucleoside-diphosphate-sugar epimerase